MKDKNRAYNLVTMLIFKPSNTPFNEIFSHFNFLCSTFHSSVCVLFILLKMCFTQDNLCAGRQFKESEHYFQLSIRSWMHSDEN